MNVTLRRNDADARVTSDAVPVWDRFVRLFHWSLVAAVLVALTTSLILPPTWVRLHIIAGVSAVTLVGARIVWGFLGPTYARFSSFVPMPSEAVAHIRALRRGAAEPHAGHNPLGGAMIVALIAVVLALGLTGVIAEAGILKTGPLAFLTTFAAGSAARAVHTIIAWGLIGLIVLHLGGVLFESLRSRENLAAAMVHGRKQARGVVVTSTPREAKPLLAAAVVLFAFLAAGTVVVTFSQRPALGVPVAALDPVYASECGDCHAPYHPSLQPAAVWTAIMAHLSDHFGEDASVEPSKVAQIRDYLVANAAETADTKAANVFRRRDTTEPLAITATPFWRRTHAGIADTVFAAKSVGSRSNCNACHQDAASGLFNPEAIAIPKDAKL